MQSRESGISKLKGYPLLEALTRKMYTEESLGRLALRCTLTLTLFRNLRQGARPGNCWLYRGPLNHLDVYRRKRKEDNKLSNYYDMGIIAERSTMSSTLFCCVPSLSLTFLEAMITVPRLPLAVHRKNLVCCNSCVVKSSCF